MQVVNALLAGHKKMASRACVIRFEWIGLSPTRSMIEADDAEQKEETGEESLNMSVESCCSSVLNCNNSSTAVLSESIIERSLNEETLESVTASVQNDKVKSSVSILRRIGMGTAEGVCELQAPLTPEQHRRLESHSFDF